MPMVHGKVDVIKLKSFTYHRERRLVDQELLVKAKEEELQREKASVEHLHQDMLQQYNAILASLPNLEDRHFSDPISCCSAAQIELSCSKLAFI